MDKKVRVRFAPSPTGNLHVGGARTALFNYAFAKRHKGDFVLRIDDTDLDRNVDGSVTALMNDLLWLGITWDEGIMPDGSVKGNLGPYRQSDRLSIYKDHALDLVKKGLAYYCFLPDDFDGPKNFYRDLELSLALDKVSKGDSFVIRFKVPKGDLTFFDDIRGKVSFSTDVIDDFVLIRSNGVPTYNFATAVDDHLMDITHVIRADEHLNNTLPQLLIYKAFDWVPPKFAHISLILGPDRSKLSKRHGAASVGDFRRRGILPSALVNYLSLLGWSHPKKKDIFPVNDLFDNFSLKKVNVAPAVFDDVKLLWMNGTYIRSFDDDVIAGLIKDLPWPKGVDLACAASLYKTNASTLKDYLKVVDWTNKDWDFKLDSDALSFLKNNDKALAVVDDYLSWLDSDMSFDDFLSNSTAKGIGGRDLYWTLRIAAIGSPHGPDNRALVKTISLDVLKHRALLLKKGLL